MNGTHSIGDPDFFDVIVVGAGPGGEDVTLDLVGAGLTVAMIESELIGGDCFNWACVPSKALLRPGHAVLAARRLPGTHVARSTMLDAPKVLAHRDHVVLHHDDSTTVAEFEEAGATFFRGRGRLEGDRAVQVAMADGSERHLLARTAVVLATGSVPTLPEVPGLVKASPWTNREATSAGQVPERLIVLGSGAAGLELAQAWKWLGSREVVLLSRRETLLPDLEPFVGELVHEGLTQSGVEVRFGVQATRVERPAPNGEVVITLTDGSSLVADELLVATGKSPSTGGLGLETVGLQSGGPINVDDVLSVDGLPWLYAIGDVNGRAMMTHQASYQARVAAAAIVARAAGAAPTLSAVAEPSAVPQVIFTDPEVATVGLSTAAATAAGVDALLVEADLGAVLGAQLHAKDYTGRASLLIDREQDVVIGATFVGQDVADMVHAATIAIVGNVPISRLRHAVPSFPTMSEVWLNLLSQIKDPVPRPPQAARR